MQTSEDRADDELPDSEDGGSNDQGGADEALSASKASPSREGTHAEASSSPQDGDASKVLFVAGLGLDVSKEMLADLFREKFADAVQESRIVLHPSTKQSRGFGFIVMTTPEQAQEARQAFNGTEYRGGTLRIELAKRSQPYDKTPGEYKGPRSKCIDSRKVSGPSDSGKPGSGEGNRGAPGYVGIRPDIIRLSLQCRKEVEHRDGGRDGDGMYGDRYGDRYDSRRREDPAPGYYRRRYSPEDRGRDREREREYYYRGPDHKRPRSRSPSYDRYRRGGSPKREYRSPPPSRSREVHHRRSRSPTYRHSPSRGEWNGRGDDRARARDRAERDFRNHERDRRADNRNRVGEFPARFTGDRSVPPPFRRRHSRSRSR